MRRLLLFAAAVTTPFAAQKVWREYPAFEYNNFPIPPDYQEKTEFAFARLIYPNASFSRGFGRRGGFGGGSGTPASGNGGGNA